MDLDNIWGSWLDYQLTDEFKAEESAQREIEAAQLRPIGRRASAKYRLEHPDLVAMRHEAKQHHETLAAQQGNLCYICHKPLDGTAEIDHKHALIKRANNDLSNLCVVHRTCNRHKAAK